MPATTPFNHDGAERRSPFSALLPAAFSLGIAAAFTVGVPGHASAQGVPSVDVQIAQAVLSAPMDRREGARVLGYTAAGDVVELREGSNDLVCLADNPAQEGFNSACYHVSMEPYMARGRELTAQGIIDGGERNRIRWEEADAGTLPMPEEPATLYILSGESYDEATGEVEEAYLRFVVYTPWATPESTGLPARPMGPGAPWLMFPGTAGAHIMISPPMG